MLQRRMLALPSPGRFAASVEDLVERERGN